MKKALLVGINYPGTSNELRGCVNDVMSTSDIITKHFGFDDPKNRRMLTDASATTANIIERLEWLVDGAGPGDVLFFHYSGHGSQVINQKYDVQDYEPDGMDEIICPIDLDWRDKMITDDMLKAIFDKVPTGVNLTVFLDSCHSGTMLDQSNQYQPLRPSIRTVSESPNRPKFIAMPADITNRGIGLNLAVRPRSLQTVTRDVNQTGLLLSGCRSDQTSADAWIHNKYTGAATYYLTKVLASHSYDVDYKTLVDEMNAGLQADGYNQCPELDGSPLLFAGKFLHPII